MGIEYETKYATFIHCFTEFLATLLFVYIGCGSCISSYFTEKEDIPIINGVDSARLLIIAFSHGFAILLLVFATAHISGAHINPVVSLAMIITGNIRPLKGACYIVCQFVGGICGALILRASFYTHDLKNFGQHDLGNGITIIGAIIVEFVLTFLLVFVIFSTAVNSRAPHKFAPIAIGLAVLVDHMVGVPFTGASMNPARTLAPALATWSAFDHLYVYFIGPPLGAIAAGLFYKYVMLKQSSQINTWEPLN
jgi:MIP family channel proteins